MRGAGSIWQGGKVNQSTPESEPAAWLALPEVAARLGLPVNKVHRMVQDGKLLAVRRGRELQVPAELVANHVAIKHLPGVLTLLRDAGYNDEEALRWLYQPDETLPGRPADAIGKGGATEVKRRAQALGF